MRSLNRRGFTLVELLIGLTMLAILATAMVAVVRGAGAAATRASAALFADRTRVSLQTFLQQELRDAASGDVTLLSPVRATLPRPIGEALPCADSAGVLLVPDADWNGTRLPAGARDDAWLLVDAVAESWLHLAIDSVTTGNCPATSAPAISMHVPAHAGRAVLVRVMEPVELSAYRSGATDWFGLTPANHSSSVQPFAGPLVPNATRFTLYTDRLEIVLPPTGVTPSTVMVPLGPL